MRLVVLHGDQALGAAGQRVGVSGRKVSRVHVVGDPFRLDSEEMPVQIDRDLEMFQRLQVLHVADVLAKKGKILACEAKGVLEIGSCSQDRFGVEGQADREGRVAARAAKGLSGAQGGIFIAR